MKSLIALLTAAALALLAAGPTQANWTDTVFDDLSKTSPVAAPSAPKVDGLTGE